jgi:hypothetical protein
MQVHYCDKCGVKVSETDVEWGRGSVVGGKAFCSKCKPLPPVPVAGQPRKSGANLPAIGAGPRKSNPALPAVAVPARKSNPALPAVNPAARKSNPVVPTVTPQKRKTSTGVPNVAATERKSNPALPAVNIPASATAHAAERSRTRESVARNRGTRNKVSTSTLIIIGMVLCIIGLVLIYGRHSGTSRQNPPPEIKPETTPGPDTSPEISNAPPPEEMAAITAWTRAEDHYKAQQWKEAKAAYEEFQQKHANTKEGKERAETLKSRLIEVEKALAAPPAK